MKRLLVYSFVLLLVLAATGTNAQFALRETYITYYLDDAYLDYAGYWNRYCDFTVDTDNQVGSWRVYDQYSCNTGLRVVHRCQQTNGMGGWINLSCPPNQP